MASSTPISEPATISDIIVTGISNICSKVGLNAKNFRLSDKSNKLYWNASCGIIGPVLFHIQYNLLEENLTKGLEMVSVIIAFTDLLTKEENRRFTENIMRAHYENRSPSYFNLSASSEAVVTYVPMNRGNFYGFHSYDTIYVNYTFNGETGEYSWVIPDTPEVPVEIRLNNDEMTGSPPDLTRGITSAYAPVHLPDSVLSYTSTAARVGLERGFSSGIPVSVASQTIEDSLTPYRAVNIEK
jgi:hypothetical protein